MPVDLLVHVSASRPAVRRECLDYLNRHTALSPNRKQQSEGEKLLSLWAELAPDPGELDAYGGGDHATNFHVSDLLHEITQSLSRNKIEPPYRKQLLDNAHPYIECGNAGLDDKLYDMAPAACYNEDDWRSLAEAFETWVGTVKSTTPPHVSPTRQPGKYLELHQRKPITGAEGSVSTPRWSNRTCAAYASAAVCLSRYHQCRSGQECRRRSRIQGMPRTRLPLPYRRSGLPAGWCKTHQFHQNPGKKMFWYNSYAKLQRTE